MVANPTVTIPAPIDIRTIRSGRTRSATGAIGNRPAVGPSQNADVAADAAAADWPSASRWLGSQPPTPASTPTYSMNARENRPTVKTVPRPPVRPTVDDPFPSVGAPAPRTRLSGTARAAAITAQPRYTGPTPPDDVTAMTSGPATAPM